MKEKYKKKLTNTSQLWPWCVVCPSNQAYVGAEAFIYQFYLANITLHIIDYHPSLCS